MPSDRVTVIVPTYNELGSIEAVAVGVISHGYRLLIVDDASPDGTGQLAEELRERSDLISVLHRPIKEGLGPAYVAGFDAALAGGAEIVCEMDADLSHDPARLSALVAAVEQGADLAIGSRLIPGGRIVNWAPWRRALSRWGNRYARFALGVPVRDITSGFRAFTAESLSRLNPETCKANGYAFQIEMAWKAHRTGMHVVEVPITFIERASGRSKLSGGIVFEAMLLVTRWGVMRLLGRGRTDAPRVPAVDE